MSSQYLFPRCSDSKPKVTWLFHAAKVQQIFETAKFYSIFSVTITKISIFNAVLGISSLGHRSVEKTEVLKKGKEVMVSPYISQHEKEVLAVLLKEERSVIVVADNGFGEYYKPSEGLFDSVAAGKVLILSPWEYDPKKKHVSREDCVEMNRMAEEICGQWSD